MLRLIPLLFATLAMACSSACGPSEVEIGDSADSNSGSSIIDVDPPSDPVPLDPYPWATWETCAHNIDDNPCNFQLMDQNGEQTDLYKHYGKVILLDFSVMWCGPCNMIAPIADEWQMQYGEDNFVWITILIEDSAGGEVDLADLQQWVSSHGTVVPVLAGSRDLIDLTDPLEDGYPITSWPTIVVIDKSMTLRHGINGWHEGTVQGWVEGLL